MSEKEKPTKTKENCEKPKKKIKEENRKNIKYKALRSPKKRKENTKYQKKLRKVVFGDHIKKKDRTLLAGKSTAGLMVPQVMERARLP